LVVASNKHIVILCSRLDLPGGIERAIVNLSDLFITKGQRVTLLILDETSEHFYQLHPSIQLIRQPFSFGITKKGNVITRKLTLFSDLLKLRRLLKQCKADLVIATEYPFAVAAKLSGKHKRSKLVSWENNHFNWPEKNRFWSSMINLTYPGLDAIVCLTKQEQEHFKKFAKAIVIPYHVQPKSKLNSHRSKTILSVSWLNHRKGIDMMLPVAKKILTKHPDWKWKHIGKGEMMKEAVKFISENNLQERFILQPPTGPDLSDEYANSSLFVLSSRFEAFPMVLLEAMSSGLPCISFDCPSGPSEIITTNEDGILVENGSVEKLTEAISALIADEVLRKKMGEKAFENIQRFSPENIYKLWQELL
jgi:glycosyltransferase involved in cell wall biosynthesis